MVIIEDFAYGYVHSYIRLLMVIDRRVFEVPTYGYVLLLLLVNSKIMMVIIEVLHMVMCIATFDC